MEGEFYKESKNKSREYSDRYRSCKVLEDKETNDILLATREIVDIPTHPNDTYHRVKSHEVCRLDILAHTYYQNPLLWWVIAQANEIHDPFRTIEPGSLLRIPTIETLYGNNGVLL